MRNSSFVAFASVLAASLAATSVAHADPASLSARAETTAAPSSYVQGGGMVGGDNGYAMLGGSIELGKRVAPDVWVHANLTDGATGKLFASGTGNLMQARVGADLMSCGSNGILCAYLGGDLGVQNTQFSGMDEPLFCDGDCEGSPISEHSTFMIGVARAGLDIGGTHLRWRPGVEISFAGAGASGLNGVNLTQSLAYRF